MTETRRNPLYSILLICFAAMGVAALGIILARSSHDASLQPALTSYGAIFVYVWPLPFMLMAYGAALVRVSAGSFQAASEPLGLYFLQLTLALGWCIMAFHFHESRVAAALLVTMLLMTLLTMQAFARHSEVAPLLQLPWLIWIIVALYLSLRALYST